MKEHEKYLRDLLSDIDNTGSVLRTNKEGYMLSRMARIDTTSSTPIVQLKSMGRQNPLTTVKETYYGK